MIQRAAIFFKILLLTTFANAQEIEWQNTIGGNGDDRLYSIQQTTDGGYILGGSSSSNISGDKTENSNGGNDYWIVKTDSVGNILWQNTIGGNSTDQLYSVIQSTDGGYLLGGWSVSNISGDKNENSHGTWDYWIVKTDLLGTILWQKTIGGTYADAIKCVINTTDDGFLLGGYSSSNGNGSQDYWIIKINSIGIVEWDSNIGGTQGDLLNSVIQTTDGGYLLGGYSHSNISGDKTENSNGGTDYWIVKTDSVGAIEWQNTIGGSLYEYLTSVNQTPDGGYILGGHSNSNISGDKTENSNGDKDYWIVKTNSIGIIEWQNTIGGSSEENCNSLIVTSDNGYLLGGFSRSLISTDKSENTIGLDDYWVVKIDSTGNIEWQNSIGGNEKEQINSLIQTKDGGYLIGGNSNSNLSADKIENTNGFQDYWILKITNNYNLIQGTTYADLNSNQTQEQGDPAIPYLKIIESNTNRFTFSEHNGFYSVAVLDTGNFEIAPNYFNLYNTVPIVHTGNFTSINQIDSLNDFAFQPSGTFNDLCLTTTPTGPFRSGFNASYSLYYSNQGTTALIPTIVFYPDTNVGFVSASFTPTTVTTDSVIFVLGSLTPFQSGQITITVSVDLGLPIGTLVNSGAMILPIANDANPGCNSSCWEVFTTGSYDPNDILVNRSFLYDYEMPSPPDLEYIIRFQNTGNDTAFTVKILNPLDTTRLDLSTLDIVSTSHNADVRFVYHERNLEFVMNNILLPDSNTNEPMSHGFVRYRIKPKTTVAVGDSIQNFAAIYFDFNSPVITNTAVTNIIIPTGITTPTSAEIRPLFFPNPVNNELTIRFDSPLSQKVTIQLYNIYGQKVKELFSDFVESGKWIKKFDMSDLSSGVYFIKMDSAKSSIHKVIKL